ncbi:MAG: type II restriction endonuclease [Clostridia bacterium]|nr:type II restriction endonuclease [Clostridia bacterium]
MKPNSGEYPYVTAGEDNNSVSTYIDYDKKQIEKGNGIMIGGKTLVITYQEKEYFSNDSHNLALYLKDKDKISENIAIYLVSALYKSLKPIYSWGNSISGKKIKKDIVNLPVKDDKTIDYEYMEKYINVIKKISIKSVILWKDKIIEKTKDCI